MLGATLPANLHAWRLTDSAGGVLLLAGWGGSTAGAVLARSHFQQTAAAGLASSAFALLALSFAPQHGLVPMFFLYGLGLGLTMTAISLLQSREVSSERADLELNRLNLVWAAGACLAPALALHSLRLLSVSDLYRLLGCCFLAVAAVLLLTLSTISCTGTLGGPVHAKNFPKAPPLAWAPLRFGIFAAASVGLESALGSWLTTFAERNTVGVGTAALANAAFWLGLLLSRAAHSMQSARWLTTRAARALHLFAVGTALAVLIVLPGRFVLLSAGLICGFGLGPLYPYVLSQSLPRFRSTMVFVLAGVGASAVPWLTGVLSSAGGSLRIGLLVPAATFLVLLGSDAAINADARRTTDGSADPPDEASPASITETSNTLRSR